MSALQFEQPQLLLQFFQLSIDGDCLEYLEVDDAPVLLHHHLGALVLHLFDLRLEAVSVLDQLDVLLARLPAAY